MRGAAPFLSVWLVLLAVPLSGCSEGSPDGPDEGVPSAAEAGVLTGRLTAAGTSNRQEIAIASAGHERLAIVLVLVNSLPETELAVNVTGPGGRSAELETSPILYALPGNRPAASFAAPEAGAWSALVELRSGATADYEVHWCADDADAAGPQDNLACQRSYS